MSSVETPDGAPEMPRAKRSGWRRYAFGAAGAVIVIVTFAVALPRIANYSDVWDVVTTLTWQWAAVLVLATVLNLATFPPPWMVTLPGLGFRQALAMTQASTALSIVAPGRRRDRHGGVDGGCSGGGAFGRATSPARSR